MKKRIMVLLILLIAGAVIWAATGNEDAVLTSSVDRRNQEPLIKPVWEHVITWTYDADDAGAETQSINVNGILLKVVMTIPDTTTDTTTEQLLIKDNGDNTIFDSGELTEGEGVTYTFNLFEPLSGTIDIILEPSAASQDAVTTKVVTLRGI